MTGGDTQLLTVDQMYRADALAMAAGIAGETLMEAAGAAVAREIRRRFRPCRVVVLCGPGNNGGDGFVIARLLAQSGFSVRLALLGDVARLSGDAATMAARWPGAVETVQPGLLDRVALVVDALFGAGLSRPLDGAARIMADAVNQSGLPVVAVDVPSGVGGDDGQVRGVAIAARLCVTFFRKKPAHLLLPGRDLCGQVVVADIGIPPSVLGDIGPAVVENTPSLWLDQFPRPGAVSHKYHRGHLLVMGGAVMTGAARLAARAAHRVGAGLVTLVAPPQSLDVFRLGDPGCLVAPLADYGALLADSRHNALVIGPGAGLGEVLRGQVIAALAAGKACVVDADALTSFSSCRDDLFRHLSPGCVLTPHDGELARLWGVGMTDQGRLALARQAARQAGAIVVSKGSDCVIAHPDGRAAINSNAPPWLATAGSGDVLAGLIGGLLAQGMDAFLAACAAVWLHGEAAGRFGPGLIAEDLPEGLPNLLTVLYSKK